MLIGRHFGHIRVTQVVGQGGMGDVYGGYDEKLERKVALKVLNDDQRLDAEARERLLREARALSQLDHPNICRIHDYIETPDLDLLVLEYIDGQTLHEAMQSGISHHEKLRIAVAVADVLIQAHRAGIVHRDLKPENVMLTKGGEVKVLDFGLARWLQPKRKSSDKYVAVRASMRAMVGDAAETTKLAYEEAPHGGSPRRDFLATAAGITLGTPLFMSPEQARGEALTPASDMFSFGLMLQTLFTGEDPHPTDLTAREVILRVARGHTQPVRGAPGDVTALINRLKQFAPADRPTAVETAERLRFFTEKPQRIARRAIVAALVLIALLGTWRYMVDLQRARALALASEAEAVRRRAQAEEMINFMVGDLRSKLEPVGRLDILDDVAERALAYSASLDLARLSPEELVRNAKALHQLVQVRIAQGRLDDALQAASRANSLTDAAAQRDAQSADVQVSVAMSHFSMANVHRLRSELPQALRHAEAYRDVTARLAAAHPAHRDYQAERDYGQAAVATILELQGDLTRAANIYESSVVQRRERVRRDPKNATERAQLAVALNKLGFVRQRLGDLAAARRHFNEELSLYETLTAADPEQKRWRERLINAHSYVGGLLDATGDEEGAVTHRRAEIAIGTELHRHDPANADWHRNLAVARMHLGDLLRRRGDVAGALALIENAERLLEELVGRKEARKSWRKDLAVVRTAHARALLAGGHVAQAVTVSRRANAEITSTGLTDPLARRHEAEAAMTLGEALAASGDQAAARKEWQRAAQIIEPLAGASSDPLVLDLWSRTLLRLGRQNDASAVLTRLDRFGYHSRDLDRLRMKRTG